MQNYTNLDLEKFKEMFQIKEKQSEIERNFLEKTKKYIKLIKWIPWLEMVWVWNSVAMNSATQDSDIDLYIVTKPNYMWLNRILITFIFQILFVRKTSRKHAWRFCLSFFSTTNWMDFYKFVLLRDPYLFFWILYFKPILSKNNTYEKFIEINSKWWNFWDFKEVIEENKKEIIHHSRSLLREEGIIGITKKLDIFLKKIFLPKTLRTYEKLWKPFWVIINDDLLKFHNNDIRREVAEKFSKFTKI